MKILNFTLHQQGEEVTQFLEKELGEQVEITEPKAPEINPSASMEVIRLKVREILENEEFDLLLVGGQTSIMYSAIRNTNKPVIEIGTERKRDENDRFIFVPRSVRFIRR